MNASQLISLSGVLPVPASSRVTPLPQGLHSIRGIAIPVGAGLPAKRPVLATHLRHETTASKAAAPPATPAPPPAPASTAPAPARCAGTVARIPAAPAGHRRGQPGAAVHGQYAGHGHCRNHGTTSAPAGFAPLPHPDVLAVSTGARPGA